MFLSFLFFLFRHILNTKIKELEIYLKPFQQELKDAQKTVLNILTTKEMFVINEKTYEIDKNTFTVDLSLSIVDNFKKAIAFVDEHYKNLFDKNLEEFFKIHNVKNIIRKNTPNDFNLNERAKSELEDISRILRENKVHNFFDSVNLPTTIYKKRGMILNNLEILEKHMNICENTIITFLKECEKYKEYNEKYKLILDEIKTNYDINPDIKMYVNNLIYFKTMEDVFRKCIDERDKTCCPLYYYWIDTTKEDLCYNLECNTEQILLFLFEMHILANEIYTKGLEKNKVCEEIINHVENYQMVNYKISEIGRKINNLYI
ncbi:hypothetical protein EHP00_1079 [Ecytonucleospora hepatopenaei]|uniref:Uncharacterized protein n=1 Tax=Ecytonucleospora hepatopenaei TaxID=646526 RepID=A0A1W0E531_9MICR|nr:hypothetical protein EHP00_1079 [Ecytonucleospora hepatopenaei]